MTDNLSSSEEQRSLLELLGELMIPSDHFDDGLKDAGFSGIIEMRNMYQPWMAQLYEVGLRGIEEISHLWYGKSFLYLLEPQQQEIIRAIASENPPGSVWTEQESAQNFYSNLHMDACFVYCTSADVWERIGFPGPSFENGGYLDYQDLQT